MALALADSGCYAARLLRHQGAHDRFARATRTCSLAGEGLRVNRAAPHMGPSSQDWAMARRCCAPMRRRMCRNRVGDAKLPYRITSFFSASAGDDVLCCCRIQPPNWVSIERPVRSETWLRAASRLHPKAELQRFHSAAPGAAFASPGATHWKYWLCDIP